MTSRNQVCWDLLGRAGWGRRNGSQGPRSLCAPSSLSGLGKMVGV